MGLYPFVFWIILNAECHGAQLSQKINLLYSAVFKQSQMVYVQI